MRDDGMKEKILNTPNVIQLPHENIIRQFYFKITTLSICQFFNLINLLINECIWLLK